LALRLLVNKTNNGVQQKRLKERRYSFSASLKKEICHEGTKARSRKMLRIFLCAFGSFPQDPAEWLTTFAAKLRKNFSYVLYQ
jgi:hypothetical protein